MEPATRWERSLSRPTGGLLELVVLHPDEDDATVIHADICRTKFYRYL